MDNRRQLRNNFVISTVAQRSGEICGFFSGSHTDSKAQHIAEKCRFREESSPQRLKAELIAQQLRTA
jgi:hypothetical protein